MVFTSMSGSTSQSILLTQPVANTRTKEITIVSAIFITEYLATKKGKLESSPFSVNRCSGLS